MTNAKEIRSKNWFVTMLLLVAAMVVPSAAWAQEMYTVFDTETGTLTFKYDSSKPESTDTQKVYDVPTSVSEPGWITKHKSAIQTVVFEASFADARPTTCYDWFFSCNALTKIEGIKNLNTSEVTDMSSMFYKCSQLTTLDLSSFNTAKVTDMYYMFYTCSKLTTIYVSGNFTTDGVKYSTDMFSYCSSLVGAIGYNSGITDKTGANYRTGYFTCGIVTAEDLKDFAQSVNGTYTPAEGETATAYPNLCAVLMKNIALTAEDIIEPMGKNGSYTGKFDGRGHTISGLNLTSTNNSLFANNSSGTIKNLGVVNATIAEGSNGSICQSNSGTIESCFFAGTPEGTTSPSGAVCQTNSSTITNCYYLADSETDAIEGTTAMTAAQFKSGAVAWLLNGSSSDGDWGQQLGTEDYPVWGGAKVYQCTPCTGVYSNDENEVSAEHTIISYDSGFGTCSICGAKLYQPATLNGSGEYEISNAGQLYWFAGMVNGTLDGVAQNSSVNAVLTADITVNENVLDASGNPNSGTFRSWTPIGNSSYICTGIFDGRGHTVSGLYFNDSNIDNVGMFGYIETQDGNFRITNVGVVDSYFRGNERVGGVCGTNYNCSLEYTYFTGTVCGNSQVGGLCGYLKQGSITNCSNVGSVTSTGDYVGGLCGFLTTNSTITNAYNAGAVSGNGSNVGSIYGINNGSNSLITCCYYLDDEESDTDVNATFKTTSQFENGELAYLLLQGCDVYLNNVFIAHIDGSAWGQQLGVDSYPVPGSDKTVYRGYKDCLNITYSNNQEEMSDTPVHHFDNGICKACEAYQPATLNKSGEYEIGNAGQLCWFAGLVNGTLTDGTPQNTTAKGVLTDNIDLSGISNWTPIGNESNKFGGTFDGKNFKVQHLSITQQGSNTGLFGFAYGATLQNICIDGNFTLTTTSYTEGYGSIAGCVQNSTISNCHSSVNFTINTEMDASVNCIGHIGGIVGKMYETSSTDSNVSGCSYSGTINLGNNKVNVAAGIAGYAIYSNVPITNCSFTGTIHSECEDALIMGGIFGYTRTGGNVKVTNCLQAGTLEKPGNSSLTGILIGQINTGYGENAVTNNYYTASTFNVIGSATGTPTTTPATQCTANQLLSGEICYLLNGSSSDGAWGQQIGTDSYPVPGSDKTVYEVNLLCGGVTNLGKTYANNNEDVTIAHELPETATFDSEKKIYGKVCQRESCGVHLGYFADAAGTIKAKLNDEATAFIVSSYTLEDATAYDSKAEFIVKSLDYKRTFSHNDWVAVYVPFAIDCSKLPSDVEMVVINNFHEYEQEDGTYNVVLEVKHKTSGTIPALTPCAMRLKPPFIFNPSPKTGNLTPNVMPMNTALTEPVVMTMYFSNAAFSAAAVNFIDCASMERYYKFTGSLAGMEAGSLNDGTDFVLNQGKLNKANEKTSLKAQRWYLSATDRNGNSSASIASLRSIAIEVVGESDVTGIEDIHVITEREAPVREGIYDLQGRKLNSEPAEGIYIKNGIKYVK